MALSVYKPNRGLYARGAAGAALVVLALFASVRFFQVIGIEKKFALLAMPVSYGVFWAGGLFVVLAGAISVFAAGFETGWKALDGRTHAFIDLLIDTEGELQKVSWPNRQELRRSTTVVIICIVVMGGFLAVVDLIISAVMSGLRVLPR
jgi:preprotein translocase subunit SecE